MAIKVAYDDVSIRTFSAIYDVAGYAKMIKINIFIDIHDVAGVRRVSAAPAKLARH